MCSDAHIEVKKQLCGISSLLPLFMVSRDELRCLTCLVRAFTHWTIALKHCKVFCFVLNQLCTNTFKKIVINLLNYEYKNKTSFDQVLNEFKKSKAGKMEEPYCYWRFPPLDPQCDQQPSTAGKECGNHRDWTQLIIGTKDEQDLDGCEPSTRGRAMFITVYYAFK